MAALQGIVRVLPDNMESIVTVNIKNTSILSFKLGTCVFTVIFPPNAFIPEDPNFSLKPQFGEIGIKHWHATFRGQEAEAKRLWCCFQQTSS